MAVTTTQTNKPLNPRGNDQSPKGYNRAELYTGKALDFDGVNDYVSVPNISTQSTNVWTYEGKIYFDAIDGYWFDGRTSNVGYGVYFRTGTKKINLFSSVSGENSFNYLFDTGRWYNIAITLNATTATLYVNGKLAASLSYNDALVSTGPLIIGSRHSLDSSRFNGSMSGFRAFNVALTAAQVADLYNNPEKVVPTGVADSALKLWLPMQEGAGTTAYDGSSTENGPDLIVNGDFATDSDWTKGTGWTISGGVATHDSSLGPGDLYQDFNLTIGKSYKITIEITATDTTELYFMTDSGDYVEVSGSPIGVHSHVFVADDSSHRVGVRGSSNWDGSVDNITLEELNFANHGTISGATYTHAIGAPVSQTAVIDWNKGTNYFDYSESFSQGLWVKGFLSVTEDQATAPNGLDTADKFTELSSDASQGHYTYEGKTFPGTQLATASVYLKDNDRGFGFAQIAVDGAVNRYTIVVDLSDGSVTDTTTYGSPTNTAYEVTNVGNGWYRLSVSATHTSGIVYIVFGLSNSGTPSYTATIEPAYAGDGSSSIYSWGAQLNAGSVGPYVPTFGTAQTSEVLLPQGLTTGRDITGVNLFENVRKQGALNLDGNSWAEVHDNASLDITDAITLEAWVKWEDTRDATGIMGRWGATTDTRSYMLYIENSTSARLYINGVFAEYTSMTTGWRHIVGTYDKANMRLYVDGTQVAVNAQINAITTNAEVLEIGRYRYASVVEKEYTNQIAQPRIYNRALTADEISQNYKAGKYIYK